jgi:hypothetical protein
LGKGLGKMKTNSAYWNELNADGKLFSCLKDGLPHNFWEYLLAYAYPIIIVGMVCIGIYSMVKFKPSERKWKTYLFSISCGTILGAAWCILMQKHDPNYPGWLFAPWSVTGVEFGMTLEDWVFMVASTTLFYVIFRKLSTAIPLVPSKAGPHAIVIICYCILAIGIFAETQLAGKTQIVMHMLPGIAFYVYARKVINCKNFLVFQISVILFEVGWDLLAVSLIHFIPGLAWASEWSYISFDAQGRFFHSTIFLNYGTHRWAWLLLNPLEITPLMGICGGILNYAMFVAGDKYFYSKSQVFVRRIP